MIKANNIINAKGKEFFCEWVKVHGHKVQCDLRKAELSHVNLVGAVLKGALLNHAHLDRSYLDYVDFDRATLDGANMYLSSLHKSNLSNVSAIRANFTQADMKNIHAPHANFTKCWMKGANMTNGLLHGACFHEAEMIDCNMEGANIDFSSFSLAGDSLDTHFDDRQIIQQLYNLMCRIQHSRKCSLSMKKSVLTDSNIDVANKFHHIGKCRKVYKW